MAPAGAIFSIVETGYSVDLPLISERRNRTIKIKNSTLAIPAALAAMPPNPKIAAMIATTKKIIVQRNI